MMRPISGLSPLGESAVDDVRAIRAAIDEEVNHELDRLAALIRRNSDAIREEFKLKSAAAPPPARGPRPGDHE